MTIQRNFLDWTEPALPLVIRDLIQQYSVMGKCDLSNVIAVFPGQEARRRFQERLTFATKGKLTPPTMVTVGQLPELLYEPKWPFATPLTQRLAWAEALKSQPTDALKLILANPPEDRDMESWMTLGELLSRQHQELAADLLNFKDVADRGRDLKEFNEEPRWRALWGVQQLYLQLLDSYQLWDQQTSRLVAIEQKECHLERDLVLIGTADLNRTMRSMLDQVRDKVTAYVHAPQTMKNHFDEHGCLIPDAWANKPIEIDDDQIQVADGPAHQAALVVQQLDAYDGTYAVDDITVCVPDDRIVPHVRRSLSQFQIDSRWVIAQQVSQSRPFRLLEVVASYLGSERTDQFAELIRHPDIVDWIDQHEIHEDWLTHWDHHLNTHLQRHFRKPRGHGESTECCQMLSDMMKELLSPLTVNDRPLGDWAEPLIEVLLQVYRHVEFDQNDPDDEILLKAVEEIHQSCVDHTSLPEDLVPVVSAQQAIELTLEQVRQTILPPPAIENAIQLYGWLDMSLDDAPAAIVTTMNEGYVPSSVNHDLFLPNRLRAHLGLEDNARRYARDAFVLSSLLASRKDVRLIVGRRDVQGEPLTPSRLLFATEPKRIAERVSSFFGESPAQVPIAQPLQPGQKKESQFTIPRPEPIENGTRIFSVTEFSSYLSSPYRYYLARVLKLGGMDDSAHELDALGFGNLIHDVLQDWGTGTTRDSADEMEIRNELHRLLEDRVNRIYGVDVMFPVKIQVEQVKARLVAFAKWQSSWRNAGWEIRHVEVGSNEPVDFDMGDDPPIPIRGRIDRIDYNTVNQQWAILDYKTGEKGDAPEKKHRRQGEWIDLQLPLYRHLAKRYDVAGDVRLGFVVIPKDSNEIREQLAEWTESELLEADEVARATARQILAQEFWVEDDKPAMFASEYDAICQAGVFGREANV